MESDIVERLRWVKHNILADMTHEAADEIDRLRAELAAMKQQRDEAQQEICECSGIDPKRMAIMRGWDCFAQEGGGA